MSNSVSLQAAYVLHYTLYGDHDFIVDVLSMEHGRVALMARGARGARSNKGGVRALYQPFRPLLLSWMGNNELRTLVGIEQSGNTIELEGTALACAYYLNELLLRLTAKDQPHSTLFAYYALALAELERLPEDPEPTLRLFELQLLEAIGLLPDFAHCLEGGEAVEADTAYLYYPASSMAKAVLNSPDAAAIAISKKVPSNNVMHADGSTLDVGIPIHGSTLLALADYELSDKQVLADIKPLMKRILRLHLGEKGLRSHAMFRELNPPQPPAPQYAVGEEPEETYSQSQPLIHEAQPDEQANLADATSTPSTNHNSEESGPTQ